MDPLDHLLSPRISRILALDNLALEVDTEHVERPLNKDKSIPDKGMTFFIHLDTVETETDLRGLFMPNKSCILFSSLDSCNLFRYNFKVWITQRFVSFSNAKISSFGGAILFFHVFSNFSKLNTNFSSERDVNRISRWWILEALEADVSANNKVRFLIGRDLLSVQLFFINSRTIWKSQVNEYLGWGGLRLKSPVNRVKTSGRCLTGKPFSWKPEIAER